MPPIPFLVVAGIPVPVDASNASEEEETVGTFARSFDGTARSTERAPKLNLTVTLPNLTPDALDALRAAAPTGKTVACTGRAMNGGRNAHPAAPRQCVAKWGTIAFRKIDTTTVVRVPTLTLRER